MYITPFGVCSGLGIHSFTLVAIYKKSDTIAIYSCHSLQKEWKERIILLKRAKERFVLFCQKKSDLHEKPKSEFPTLQVKLDSCGMKRDISPLHSIRYSSWFPLMGPLFPNPLKNFRQSWSWAMPNRGSGQLSHRLSGLFLPHSIVFNIFLLPFINGLK